MRERKKTPRRAGLLMMIGFLVAPGGWAQDHVVLNDLIVDGNACVGFDCANGEPWGHTVLKLKDNNVRIHFDDTSSSQAYPKDDWQIAINDTWNHGAGHLSIEDLTHQTRPFSIRAGAPSNSVYVGTTGRVGFGTEQPVTKLHMVAGDAPTLRLEQDESQDRAPRTWDIGGNDNRLFIRNLPANSIGGIRFTIEADSGDVTMVAGDAPTLRLRQDDSAGETPQTWDVGGNEQRFFIRSLDANGMGGVRFAIEADSGGVKIGQNLIVAGDVIVSGNKNFVTADPEDPGVRLYFSALEGPEAGTYYRGTARTVAGRAVIDLPGYFGKATDAKGLTVHLTPMGRWGQLYVAEATLDRLVILEADDADGVEFSFLVHGVRKGYSDFQVERPVVHSANRTPGSAE